MTPAGLQQLIQTASASLQAGRLDQADKLCRQLIAAGPGNFGVLQLCGTVAYQKGNHAEAVQLLARACKITPGVAVCQMRLGLALVAVGQYTEAADSLRVAVTANPRLPEAWNHYAYALRAVGKINEATEAYQKAIALNPRYHDAIDRLGALISDTRGMTAGIPYFRQAIQIKPDYAPAWGNLGLALSADNKHAAAIEAFDRSLAIDPRLAQARVGRALVYQQTYRIEEAAAEFAAVLVHNPAHHEARSGRLLTLNYLSGKTRQEVFNEHLAFDRAITKTLRDRPKPKFAQIPAHGRRLRLAILSSDLRKHSIAYFIEPLLRHLDRTQFELVLYHDHFQVDTMSERLRGLADLWRNFVGQPHDTVEQAIRADAPDILIDLAGHTGLSRLPIFARRVAPVQISYLGYPNTSGLHEMDYHFVDAITDPGPEDDKYYTEKLVRFAPCAWAYQPPEAAPEPAMPRGEGTAPPDKMEGDSPQQPNDRPSMEGGGPHPPKSTPITFGSFNNFAKASDQTLKLWGRVLSAVPDSRLLLKAHSLNDPELGVIMGQKLDLLGLDRSRVELLGRTPDVPSHLALYNRVDIALDSFPYHGTTTTCEALWMGVPVVTLMGDRHVARVSASLLTAAGHIEWIAHSEDEYVRIATTLAGDPEKRQTLRHTLREDLRRGPLLDHAGQATRFATALRNCWEARHG